MLFEWDEEKAEQNTRKHGVDFDEAQTVFLDDLALVVSDVDHSEGEHRFVILGMSYKQRLVVVVFTERQVRIRLISARKATRSEQNCYEEQVI